VRAFLLDIEGTTTPISFVHEVLFPYSSRYLKPFLEEHGNTPDVQADLSQLKTEHVEDVNQGNQPPQLFEPYIQWLIDRDRKSRGLKSLQGKIWEDGYKTGSLQAPVFSDVLTAMVRWQQSELRINIFSSGSVLAQKLLFAHTNVGDLTKYIYQYFDTAMGKKIEANSYQKIATALSLAPGEIHFVSDVVTELDAAGEAGMITSLCIRPGNPAQPRQSQHRVIQSFDELK
jgi:enolase-phosphatase E1